MLNYTSFKGRTIELRKRVKVYKNLHNGKFSIMQNGLVVAHVDSVLLDVAQFNVNKAGRLRVIKEQKKNVHAFVTGFIKSINETMPNWDKRAVTYNPYKYERFVFVDTLNAAYCGRGEMAYLSVNDGFYVIR